MGKGIAAVIEEILERRGLRQVAEGEEPDLLVSYDGLIVPQFESTGVHEKLGPITWIGEPSSEASSSSQGAWRT